jgi:succinate dehydrogenase / fumarate reductase cytochrome b subunit
VGILYLVAWLCAASSSSETYAMFAWFNTSVIGRIFLFGWTWCLFFHLFNGIRHLFWDAGYGFDLKTAYNSGWSVVGGSVVATVAAWLLAYAVR